MTHPLGNNFLSEQAEEIKKEKEIEWNNNVYKKYSDIEYLYNINPEIHTKILIDEARRYNKKNNYRDWIFFMNDLIDNIGNSSNIRKILSSSYIFQRDGPIPISELNIHCLKKKIKYENNIKYLNNRKLLFFEKKNEYVET